MVIKNYLFVDIMFMNKAIVSWLFVHGHLPHLNLAIIFYCIWTDNYSKLWKMNKKQ